MKGSGPSAFSIPVERGNLRSLARGSVCLGQHHFSLSLVIMRKYTGSRMHAKRMSWTRRSRVKHRKGRGVYWLLEWIALDIDYCIEFIIVLIKFGIDELESFRDGLFVRECQGHTRNWHGICLGP